MPPQPNQFSPDQNPTPVTPQPQPVQRGSRFLLLGGVVVLVLAALLYWFSPLFQTSEIKTTGEPLRIGIVRYLKIYDPEIDGFIARMAELGYHEGSNVTYSIFRVDKVEETGPAVQELIAQDVDLIYAVTTVAAAAALRETKAAERTDIPIVYAQGNAPVESGIAASFKSSGNNATGVAVNFVEITAKKLEYLKMIDPDVKRVGYFDSKHTDPAAQFTLKELEKQAPEFGITLVRYELKEPVGQASVAEISSVLASLKPGDIDAYFHLPGPLMGIQAQPTIIEGVTRLGIPSIWLETPSVEIGGLFAYSHDLFALGSQAADIANKVIGGALPTDIPIEFPLKYVLAINLESARKANITLPQTLIYLANKTFGE